jgi:hypothetical protein
MQQAHEIAEALDERPDVAECQYQQQDDRRTDEPEVERPLGPVEAAAGGAGLDQLSDGCAAMSARARHLEAAAAVVPAMKRCHKVQERTESGVAGVA